MGGISLLLDMQVHGISKNVTYASTSVMNSLHSLLDWMKRCLGEWFKHTSGYVCEGDSRDNCWIEYLNRLLGDGGGPEAGTG